LVVSVAFSPDGKRFLTAHNNQTRVWDSAGTPITPPLKHDALLTFAVFSPDGKRVATTGNDGKARIWDADTGELTIPPLKHPGKVSHVAFSPDGRFVITSDVKVIDETRDGEARVWDATTGEPVTPPLVHDDHVNWAALSPDGRRVVTASNDMTARIWNLPVDSRSARHWVEMAQLASGKEFRTKGLFIPLNVSVLQERWHARRQRSPNDLAHGAGRILAWHQREAEACEWTKEWFAAIWHLDRVLDVQPHDASLWARRGTTFAIMGDRPSAIRDLTRAMELKQSDGQLPFRRGDFHVDQAEKWEGKRQ
jgi:WD40 repeat protein